MSRAEDRRYIRAIEREIKRAKPNPGVGLGWRLAVQVYDRLGRPKRARRRYPVREPGPPDIARLEAESAAKAKQLGYE